MELIASELLANHAAWEKASTLRREGKIFLDADRLDGTFLPLIRSTCKSQTDGLGRVGWADEQGLEKSAFFELFPVLTGWLESTFGQLGRVWLFKTIGKKQTIVPHIDVGAYYRNHDRHHLCIQGKYEYQVANQRISVSAGDVFWFDNQQIHSGYNTGDEDRVIAVFDLPKQGSKTLNRPLA